MSKRAIICVDDEKIVLDSLKNDLKEQFSQEFLIEVAESGEETIEIFNELLEDGYDIPLVISDFIMPEMKGDELLETIKEKKKETLSIMLTGQATIEGVTNAINRAGLYRYMSKPWEKNDLLLTVREAISSYNKDIELMKRRKELEIANAKLIKLDSAKTYFLGLLSHELNTPLIGINGNAKLISEFTDDPDVKESAQQILESEARLRKFADLSLLITRIQTDKYDTNFFEEPVNGMINQSLFNLKDKIDNRTINIIKNLPDQDFLVKVDVSLIGKVFEFILDNALKFSDEGAEVTIHGKINDKNYKVDIIDKGPGFSEDALKNVFEFFSSSDDLMSHSEGTGLSMAAAKVIMDLHNFEIRASNNDDMGACITLLF